MERTKAKLPILHPIARRIEDRSGMLHGLHALEDDSLGHAIAHADEALRPNLSPDLWMKRREALRQPSRDFHGSGRSLFANHSHLHYRRKPTESTAWRHADCPPGP